MPNLASIIADPKARKIIYAVFGILVLLAFALDVYFQRVDGTSPLWLLGVLDVLTFLAVPIAGLALANAPSSSAHVATLTMNPGDDVDIQAEVATSEAKGEVHIRDRDLTYRDPEHPLA